MLYGAMGLKMDKLYDAAKKYLDLTNYKYVIKLGRKNVITTLNISFDVIDFHHLSGLKYLQRDLPNLKKKRDYIFNEIISQKITMDKLQKSCFFTPNIEERIELTGNIMKIIDDDNTIFKYSPNQNPYSEIEAKFMLVNDKYSYRRVFLFFDEKSTRNSKTEYDLFGKSIFYEDKMDYTKRQTKMTVLYKEKINKITGKSEILLNKIKQ